MSFGSDSDRRALSIDDLPEIVFEPDSGYLWLSPVSTMKMFAQIRGWGWMQYHANGAEFQDMAGAELARRWNEAPKLREKLTQAEKEIARLKKTGA